MTNCEPNCVLGKRLEKERRTILFKCAIKISAEGNTGPNYEFAIDSVHSFKQCIGSINIFEGISKSS